MTPLIDGDILRYEIGFAAEVGWRYALGLPADTDERPLPPWEFVENCLNMRIATICEEVEATKDPIIYLSKGKNFRFDLATTKPYKGTRPENKPWHFNNLTVYLTDVLGATVVENIEADDAICIQQTKGLVDVEDIWDEETDYPKTVICSRDKDLRQCPGLFYSWELGNQPRFGPEWVTTAGSLTLDRSKKPPKCIGTGLRFFYAQLLMGDGVDNIPGCPGVGAVAAFNLLEDVDNPAEMFDLVHTEYVKAVKAKPEFFLGVDGQPHEDPDAAMLEQGRLLWMTRHLDGNNQPVLWELGMEE